MIIEHEKLKIKGFCHTFASPLSSPQLWQGQVLVLEETLDQQQRQQGEQLDQVVAAIHLLLKNLVLAILDFVANFLMEQLLQMVSCSFHY